MQLNGEYSALRGLAALDAIRLGMASGIESYDEAPVSAEEALKAPPPYMIECRVPRPTWSEQDAARIERAAQRKATEYFGAFCADYKGRCAPRDTSRGCALMGGRVGRNLEKVGIAREAGEPILPNIIEARSYEEMAMFLLGLRWGGWPIGLDEARRAIKAVPELAGKIQTRGA